MTFASSNLEQNKLKKKHVIQTYAILIANIAIFCFFCTSFIISRWGDLLISVLKAYKTTFCKIFTNDTYFNGQTLSYIL